MRLGGNEARKRNTAACDGLEATNAPSFSKVHLISGLKFTSEYFGGNSSGVPGVLRQGGQAIETKQKRRC